jgi:hypothetical protein
MKAKWVPSGDQVAARPAGLRISGTRCLPSGESSQMALLGPSMIEAASVLPSGDQAGS